MPSTNMRHHGLANITAASPWSTKRDRRGRGGAAGNGERQRQQPCKRRQPPPPSAVTDWTRREEHTGPSRPGRAQKRLMKCPSPRCCRHAAVSKTPRRSRTSSTPAGAAAGEIKPGRPRPKWGPKGPRSGPGGRRHHPPRQVVAKCPRRRPRATRSRAAGAGAPPRDTPTRARAPRAGKDEAAATADTTRAGGAGRRRWK